MAERKLPTNTDELCAELRAAAFCMPSEGRWITHQGQTMPRNVISDSALVIEDLVDKIHLLKYELSITGPSKVEINLPPLQPE